MHIFKFKEGKEYLIDHVFVLLSKDRKSISGYPDHSVINLKAADIYKKYYLDAPNYGLNTAYLSLTIEEFNRTWDTLQAETMDKLLIEKDPYEEYYYNEDGYLANHCPECLNKDTTWSAIDTAKFHRLVDKGELEKYLKRVK